MPSAKPAFFKRKKNMFNYCTCKFSSVKIIRFTRNIGSAFILYFHQFLQLLRTTKWVIYDYISLMLLRLPQQASSRWGLLSCLRFSTQLRYQPKLTITNLETLVNTITQHSKTVETMDGQIHDKQCHQTFGRLIETIQHLLRTAKRVIYYYIMQALKTIVQVFLKRYHLPGRQILISLDCWEVGQHLYKNSVIRQNISCL